MSSNVANMSGGFQPFPPGIILFIHSVALEFEGFTFESTAQ